LLDNLPALALSDLPQLPQPLRVRGELMGDRPAAGLHVALN